MKYLIGGSLDLPDPVEFLEGEALAWAQYMEPILLSMHKRNMGNIKKSIIDLSFAFDEFKRSEVSIWESVIGKDQQPLHLVSPSGVLRSNIAHHVHQPTFLTQYPKGGETADATNPCIAMLMGNAFQTPHSLIYDHILRREERSEALRDYPEAVLQCHEDFIQRIRESMEAKVEIIYGSHVQEGMIRDQDFDFDVLPLWDRYQGVSLILDRETNYSNAQSEYPYRRILLFVAHPQIFFYNLNLNETRRQDLSITVAAKIAGVPFVTNYYTEKKWREHVPRNFRQVTKLRAIYDRIAESPDIVMENLHMKAKIAAYSNQTSELKAPLATCLLGRKHDPDLLQEFSTIRPHSAQELRTLLPLALEAMKGITLNSFTEVDVLTDPKLPTCVKEWLHRQWVAVFKQQYPVTPSKLKAIHKRLCNSGSEHTTKSAAAMIRDILQLHSHSLPRKTNLDDLLYYSVDSESIETVCSKCTHALTTDDKPRWSVKLGSYAVRARRCNSKICKGALTTAHPKDSIQFVHARRPDLSVESHRVRTNWRQVAGTRIDEQLPKVVESWCIYCKDKTCLRDGRNRCVDESPRWDIGDPSKYIERCPLCVNCQSEGRTGNTRFVPVDPELPSTSKKKLTKFEQQWGHLPRHIKAQILSTERSNSHSPRLPQGQKKMREKP